jgi:hypothetical protein
MSDFSKKKLLKDLVFVHNVQISENEKEPFMFK